MPGPIHRFLAADHRRLDVLLDRATAHPDSIDHSAYAQFRAGLLKHIGMEEKILLPTVQRLRDGRPLPLAGQLRLEHGAIAALLVPTPTPDVIATLRVVLDKHNLLEEEPGGLYATCEDLAKDDVDALLAKLRAAPEVPVSPHADGSKVLGATRRALARAGLHVDNLPVELARYRALRAPADSQPPQVMSADSSTGFGATSSAGGSIPRDNRSKAMKADNAAATRP